MSTTLFSPRHGGNAMASSIFVPPQCAHCAKAAFHRPPNLPCLGSRPVNLVRLAPGHGAIHRAEWTRGVAPTPYPCFFREARPVNLVRLAPGRGTLLEARPYALCPHRAEWTRGEVIRPALAFRARDVAPDNLLHPPLVRGTLPDALPYARHPLIQNGYAAGPLHPTLAFFGRRVL